MGAAALEHLAQFIAGQVSEAGATVLKDASTLESSVDSHDVPIFDVFILAGVVPPMSEFYHAVIATYALHLLHLHPHAVALLAIFQHFCEGFVGVIPTVALSATTSSPSWRRREQSLAMSTSASGRRWMTTSSS